MDVTYGINDKFDIYSLSEKALTIEFGQEISDDLLQKITKFDQLIRNYPFAGFFTTVPAYATLSIYFDPVKVIQSDLPGNDCFEKISNYLHQLNSINEETGCSSRHSYYSGMLW